MHEYSERFFELAACQRHIQIEDHAANDAHRGVLGGVERFVALHFADGEQLLRPLGVGLENGEFAGVRLLQRFNRQRRGLEARRRAIGERDLLVERAAAVLHRALGQHARGFDELRVVHRHQRLQRRVGARTAEHAFFAWGRRRLAALALGHCV